MRSKNIILLTLSFVLGISISAEAKRIAVLPFEVSEETPELRQFGIGTMDTLTTALSNVPDFTMIDRSQLQAVLKEQALQNSGLLDQETSVETGKLLGAEIIVGGTIQKENNYFRINAKFTDIKTAQILKTTQVTGFSIFELQDKLSKEILDQQNTILTEIEKEKLDKIINSTRSVEAYNFYTQGRTEYLKHSMNSYKQAVKYFDEALKYDKNYSLALSSKAEALSFMAFQQKENNIPFMFTIQNGEQAANNALMNNYSLSEAHRALSTINLIKGNNQEGKIEAQKAIALNPNDAEAYFMLWANSSQNYNDYNINKALELNPYLIIARNQLANSYLSYGKTKEAILNYQQVLKINPSFAPAHNNLGNAYMQTGDLNKAREEYIKAINFSENKANAYNNLGNTYYRMSKLKESIESYQKAININNSVSEFHNNLGAGYFKAGNKKYALKEYNEAIKLNPDSAESYYNISVIYASNKDKKNSLKYLKKAFSVNYKLKQNAKNDPDFKNIKTDKEFIKMINQ